MQYSYRHCNIKDCIFTHATFKGEKGCISSIQEKMDLIKTSRIKSQPIKERTGGSTFKNPKNIKAWKLIDSTGLRGKKIGGALVSQKHCNFLINTGNATAKDLEGLGDLVRKEVLKKHNIELEWEIQRLGE